jgi:hypothetical protein
LYTIEYLKDAKVNDAHNNTETTNVSYYCTCTVTLYNSLGTPVASANIHDITEILL